MLSVCTMGQFIWHIGDMEVMMPNQDKKRIGELLVDAGIISSEQLEATLQQQKGQGKKIGELLIDQGLLGEKQVVDVLEFQLKIY